MNFVTDTHALLWWFIDSPKISPSASEVFKKCEAGVLRFTTIALKVGIKDMFKFMHQVSDKKLTENKEV